MQDPTISWACGALLVVGLLLVALYSYLTNRIKTLEEDKKTLIKIIEDAGISLDKFTD